MTMGEKRKLPARDRREPPAKRRTSEGISQSSSRRKTSTPIHVPTPVPEPEEQATPEPIEEPLPTKIKDGDPLPISSKPQPSLALSDKDFQSIAESFILNISLERSKKKWLSDGIFERYWTKPKKTKRDQLEGKNPPKDSMTKIGPCKIIIEPHHFDGMIYTVKDPNAKATVQIPPPQRHIVQYGPPPPQTGYQYQHYAPPQQMRPPPYPYNQPPNPHLTPPQPRPQQQPPVQRQPPVQAQGPPPPPPVKPSPDPVIQMLATRAASNPELKALMRIVASSKASQEQLRIFQGHIDELNAIIRQREEQQRRQQQQQQYYQHPQQAPLPQPSQTSQIPPNNTNQGHQEQSAPPVQSHPHPSQTVPVSASSSTPGLTPSTPNSASTLTPVNGPPESSSSLPPQSETPTPSQAGNSTNTETNTTQNADKLHTKPDNSTTTGSQINTEPGTPVVLAPAPTPAPPLTSTSPAVAPENTDSNVPVPVPVPGPAPQTASPTTTLAAPSPVSNAPKTSPVPNSIPTNQPPQPLSPYLPGPPQYPHPQHAPYPHAPPLKARSMPQYSPSTYYQSAPAPPPPKPPIKAVVFEFTSPLTPYGSSTSGHAGSGDRYLFPENAILEYQEGGTVLLASFLLVRKVDPNTKFPLEQTTDIPQKTKGKSSKSKKKEKEMAAEKSGPSTPAPEHEASGNKEANAATDAATADEKKQAGNVDDKAGSTSTENPKKEETSNLKEYYQPISMRFYSIKPAVLEPLSRIVRPPDEVRKYMEEVMDRAERAPDGFLPFRLPREKPLEVDDADDKVKAGATSTSVEDVKSKIIDQSLATATSGKNEGVEGTANDIKEEDLEFLLKDYYDSPSGLVPIRA